MTDIPFNIGEVVLDFVTDDTVTIEGIKYQSGRVPQETGTYQDCITIYTDKGIRSEKEVRKLDEYERDWYRYQHFRRAV